MPIKETDSHDDDVDDDDDDDDDDDNNGNYSHNDKKAYSVTLNSLAFKKFNTSAILWKKIIEIKKEPFLKTSAEPKKRNFSWLNVHKKFFFGKLFATPWIFFFLWCQALHLEKLFLFI